MPTLRKTVLAMRFDEQPPRPIWLFHILESINSYPPWLVHIVVWISAHGSEECWRAQAERLLDAFEEKRADWPSRLTAVQEAILRCLLPYDAHSWAAQAIALISTPDADWQSFCQRAQSQGRDETPDGSYSATQCIALAASCCHPPILTAHLPTVEEYRKVYNGYSEATSPAEWAALALKRATGTWQGDRVVDAILKVLEA